MSRRSDRSADQRDRHGWARRMAVGAVGMGAVTSMLLFGCGAASAATPAAAPSPTTVSYQSSDAVQQVVVPDGVTSVKLQVLGGAGGSGISDGNAGDGALATGSLAVTPGEELDISVGGRGGNAAYSGTSAKGGWGGEGGSGGNGVASSNDTLRNSGAGGGATTVQLADGTTLVVAGGGGGAGNNLPASGGNAGSSLTGSDGGEGGGYPVGPYGGKGHAGSNSAPNGLNGAGGSGSTGGNGGGGGGGVKGGGGGGGAGLADGGGGGGAGSSYISPTLTSTGVRAGSDNSPIVTITPGMLGSSTLGNGEVVLTWS